MEQLGPFLFVFVVVYSAFAQMGSLLFGSEMEDFTGFSASFVTLFNMLLGDFDWGAMDDSSVLALYYFWAFYLLMFYLVSNSCAASTHLSAA